MASPPSAAARAAAEDRFAATRETMNMLGARVRELSAAAQPPSVPEPPRRADGRAPSLADIAAAERAALARSTDLALGDADVTGDGDQTPLKRCIPGSPLQALVDVWCAGTWLGLIASLPSTIPTAMAAEIAPPFAFHCAHGRWRAVEAALAAVAGDAAATRALLETRATPIRMAPLHLAVSGAREAGAGRALASSSAAGADHVRVVAALLAAGASVRARDVLGMTPWHHALTSSWSPVSLAAAALLLRAEGFDANARNRAGRTVLVELAMAGPAVLPAVHLALEAGADWSIADSDGFLPIKLARLNPGFREAASAAALRKRTGANRTLEGVRVRIDKLKRAVHANGKVGVAGAFDPFTLRYTVRLEGAAPGAAPLAVPAANLIEEDVLERACAACGEGVPEFSSCSRCLKVYYCGTDCQRAHWKAHKLVCKAPTPAAAAAAAAAGGAATAVAPTVATAFVPQPPASARGVSVVSSAPAMPMWNLDALPEGKTILKVQAAIDSPADTPMSLYDEPRGFVIRLSPKEPAFAALAALMSGRHKIYVLAWKGEEPAGLVLRTDTDVEAQRW